jgi:enoyl-CoA hydratase
MNEQNAIRVSGPEDGVAVITLNRPEKRNALTFEMGERFGDAVDRLNGNGDVRAVILVGAGSSFSAGADFALLRGWAGSERDRAKAEMLEFYRRFLRVKDLEIPTIAAVRGGAIGAGASLALACDLRIASTDAKFALNFVRLGIPPGMAATFHLPRLIGPSAALELLTTGRIISGEEAERLGLVSHSVPGDALMDEARRLAREIASCAPLAVQKVKQALRLTAEMGSMDEQLECEAMGQAFCFGTEDYAEGMAAVQEKRVPRYTGR